MHLESLNTSYDHVLVSLETPVSILTFTDLCPFTLYSFWKSEASRLNEKQELKSFQFIAEDWLIFTHSFVIFLHLRCILLCSFLFFLLIN